ncbi:MAG: ADP-ribosylglycohydrolase family protein [Lachnospiraceae bacterium]|nr:ADP-ribosylglycohydrolase family protein [Lachnospiraceae bacterium]
MYNKILGGLLGAAAGDAMGAPTETRTRQQIAQRFGGYVTDFLEPPMDTFGRGNRAGQVTDDFSIAYVALEEILKAGKVDEESAVAGLLKWAEKPEFFDKFAGPTTRARVMELKGETVVRTGFVPANENNKASNGAAMKSAPIALLSMGDVDKAIDYVITVGKVTHNNNIALSGAAAIAAAASAAMKEGATLEDVVEASIYGAARGDKIGRETALTLAGPSVETRIKWAVKVAKEAENLDKAIDAIADSVGCGLMTVEAVPAAIGLCVAAKGNTVDGICAAVNIGDDTDTVATMVGGILGALNGVDSMPERYLEIIEKENNYDLRKLAEKMMEFGK